MTKTTTPLVALMLMTGTVLGLGLFMAPTVAAPGNLDLTVGTVSSDEGSVDSLTVTFSKALIHDDDGWTEMVLDDTPVDLAGLDGTDGTATIANLTLDEGEYDMLELEVDTATATVDGEDVEVVVPSGRLRVVGGFEVESDATATFEFDIHLVKRGNQDMYNLVPVIGRRQSPDHGEHGDKGDGGDDTDGTTNWARVRMALGNAKDDIGDFDLLNVTFHKARVHQVFTDNGNTTYNWTEVELDDVTVDLTNLSATNETIVGNLSLGAGDYTKIELYVSDVFGMVDGEEVEVFVPSGKLKIVEDFELKAGENASFTFDIKVVQRGMRAVYNLLPVIAKDPEAEDED